MISWERTGGKPVVLIGTPERCCVARRRIVFVWNRGKQLADCIPRHTDFTSTDSLHQIAVAVDISFLHCALLQNVSNLRLTRVGGQ